MLLVIPASILGITLISFALALTPVEIFLLLLLVTGLSTLSSLMGSFINLALPKFEFSNEVEVIKQSIASLLAVFGGFALLVTFGFLYSLLDKVLSSNMSLFLIGILLYAISIGLYVLLKPTSRKQFLKF
jgi:ABC-2 type transport system permease protein